MKKLKMRRFVKTENFNENRQKTDNFWSLRNPHVPSLERDKAVLMMLHCPKSNNCGLSTSLSKIGELNSKTPKNFAE